MKNILKIKDILKLNTSKNMIKNSLKQGNQTQRKASLFAGSLLFSLLFIFNTSISFAAIDINLKKGDENKSVLGLQNFLITNKYLSAKANGYFGPSTEKALKAFQKKNKILQTGQAGPITRNKINLFLPKVANISDLPIAPVIVSPELPKNNFSKEINTILAKDFTTSVWVPYWKERDGSAEVVNNLNKIDIISPFSYEMTETGTFKDPMKLSTGPYSEMIKKAKAEGKIIVPSILWWATGQGREDLDFVLRDDDIRGAVIYDIVQAIKKDNLDGIDIDFENKKAESREPFNKFLSELSTELHGMGKVLTCTIEARTPIDSKFAGMSAEAYQKKVSEIDYANDFKHIGKVCDQVRIMAYDQQGDDRALNNLRQSDITAYKPVADIDWVEKVLTLAMRDIEWKKIIVGVPTYGYKYEIVRGVDGKIINYKKIGSMNWFYANEEIKNKNITPKRDDGGELSYTYIDSVKNKEYYVVYSDAEAIAQKIKIAKLYKIGGIAIFKVDGNNDKNIWSKI